MSKRQEMREKRDRRKNQTRIIGMIVVGIIIVILAFILFQPLGKSNTSVTLNGLARGQSNAPVTVEEFADFQCPACQSYVQNYEPALIKDYVDTGKVYYIYTPVAFIGQESLDAAEAAYCANEQGKFWEYHDILFTNQTAENAGDFTEEKLLGFAGTLGLDTQAFQQCYDAKKYEDTIKANVKKWTGSGLNSTPSYLVNGKAVLYSDLIATIEEELAK